MSNIQCTRLLFRVQVKWLFEGLLQIGVRFLEPIVKLPSDPSTHSWQLGLLSEANHWRSKILKWKTQKILHNIMIWTWKAELGAFFKARTLLVLHLLLSNLCGVGKSGRKDYVRPVKRSLYEIWSASRVNEPWSNLSYFRCSKGYDEWKNINYLEEIWHTYNLRFWLTYFSRNTSVISVSLFLNESLDSLFISVGCQKYFQNCMIL